MPGPIAALGPWKRPESLKCLSQQLSERKTSRQESEWIKECGWYHDGGRSGKQFAMTNQVSVPAAPRSGPGSSAGQLLDIWQLFNERDTFELAVSCGNIHSSRIQSGDVLISLLLLGLAAMIRSRPLQASNWCEPFCLGWSLSCTITNPNISGEDAGVWSCE
jgi:hypothetical protein